MKLYHGTSSRHLPSILKEGLKPRRARPGNWEHTVEGCPDAVYLTAAYAHHFALQACRKNDRCVIVEIDTDQLDSFWLVPDEDAVAFASNMPGKTLREKSAHYRGTLHDFAGTETYKLSLEQLGNCCYYGAVPRRAITRIVSFDQKDVWTYSDPTITPINYHLMGEYYRALIAKTFGDEAESSSPFTAAFFLRNPLKLYGLKNHKV